MKCADQSRIFFSLYYSKKKRNIEVTLKNGKKYWGEFVGFSHGDPESGEPFIYQWQLVQNNPGSPFGLDPMGYPSGLTIKQKDIVLVKFQDDETTFSFDLPK